MEQQVPQKDQFIVGDWGSTNLRLWLIDADGGIAEHVSSDDGAITTTGANAQGVFERLTRSWGLPNASQNVFLCGMVGRRGGWIEAPYLSADRVSGLAQNLTRKTIGDTVFYIVPGLRTVQSDDVIRGEETQILGFLSDEPDFSGLVCLPGTHSKWCQISNGSLTGFHTEMTGELFELLSQKSSLREAVNAGQNWTAFDSGVAEGLGDPHAARRLFSIRANWLLRETNPNEAYSRLSGLLIGAEVARATSDQTADTVALVGSSTLTERYKRALDQTGFSTTVHSGDELVVKGLIKIAKESQEIAHA